MTVPDHMIAAPDQRIPVRQEASYAGSSATTAYRTPEGQIVVENIGYYQDTVILTEADLAKLGFVPCHAEAP